ncbi:MAG: sulfotransferase domain-containing protein [Gammaproteobacteria bacterium]
MRKVDFIVAGTQKGGTTALYSYLKEHPDICMASEKEVHFFDTEKYFATEPDYSVYHAFFQPRPEHRLLGEATPIYMYWYAAPKRIWRYHSAMKWIILLRNPIERAFSHWNMECARQADTLTFREAIQTEAVRCRTALPEQHRTFSYTDRGFYVEQLRRIWFFFPKQQTLLLKQDDFKQNPQQCLDVVCDFLELKRLENVTPKTIHALSYNTTMTVHEKAYLQHLFYYEIKQLERLLNWDCAAWFDA